MLAVLIKQYLDEHGIKHAFVANEIGVAKNVFSSMLSGKRKITAEEYISICTAVKVSSNHFAEKMTAKAR